VGTRLVKARRLIFRLGIPAASLALVGPLALATQASASHTAVTTSSHSQVTAKKIVPVKGKPNNLDCNGYSPAYKSFNPGFRRLCTDPYGRTKSGTPTRFEDNERYIGHDEPSVKFISSQAGSGNTMNYGSSYRWIRPRRRPRPAAWSSTAS
jgi:hypothetical protein